MGKQSIYRDRKLKWKYHFTLWNCAVGAISFCEVGVGTWRFCSNGFGISMCKKWGAVPYW